MRQLGLRVTEQSHTRPSLSHASPGCTCGLQAPNTAPRLRHVACCTQPVSLQPSGYARRRLRLDVVAAKKGKKGGQKKGPGSVIDIPKPAKVETTEAETEAKSKQPYEETDVVLVNLLLVENFRRKVGRPILEGDRDMLGLTKELWEASFALLFHNSFVVEEPEFIYANQAALDLFQTTWEDLIGTPSKNSASQQEQPGRQKLLDECREKGSVRITSGQRQGAKGRTFDILEGMLFNVEGPDGNKVGQATVLRHWRFEDGTEGGPDAQEPAVSEAMLQEAQELVKQQGDIVRELKEGKGLGNSDPEVQAAVDELIRRKKAAERIQATLNNGSPVIDQLPEEQASVVPDV